MIAYAVEHLYREVEERLRAQGLRIFNGREGGHGIHDCRKFWLLPIYFPSIKLFAFFEQALKLIR